MPLIKCIDCGSDVSSYATTCPKCGCPVSVSIEKNGSIPLVDIVLRFVPEDNYGWTREFISQVNGITIEEAYDIIRSVPVVIIKGVSQKTFDTVKRLLSSEGCNVDVTNSNETEEKITEDTIAGTELYQKYQPIKCPRCGSTAVTTTSRGYSLLTGFIGSNKTVNRCGKCGYTWKP